MDEKRKVILIVEDSPTNRSALEHKLLAENFSVIIAKDGEAGLKMALDKHPDLMVVDLMLPKLNGADLMKRIREDKWGKDVPIMVLTNISPDDQILQRIIDNNPCYYLLKTEVTLEDIAGKLKTVLNIS